MANFDELKEITQIALIKQLTEKTKKCGVVWNQLTASQFRATNGSLDFVLTKTGPEMTVLDILKDGRQYRSYNSGILSDVQDLFEIVSLLTGSNTGLEKARRAANFMSLINGCHNPDMNLVMRGGASLSGSASINSGSPSTIMLRPVSISFDELLTPYTGDHTDIDDAPNSNFHDGDTTYIRQEVASESPTFWGTAICGFNTSLITVPAPYRITAKLVCRTEANPGVEYSASLMVNGVPVSTKNLNPTASYVLYSLDAADVAETITDLELHLSMSTDVGDPAPRAIRVTACHVVIQGVS